MSDKSENFRKSLAKMGEEELSKYYSAAILLNTIFNVVGIGLALLLIVVIGSPVSMAAVALLLFMAAAAGSSFALAKNEIKSYLLKVRKS
jgi:hypothetical protein